MQSINFNSGNIKTFAINGDENNVIKINVSDVGILTRLKKAMSDADKIAEDLKSIKDDEMDEAGKLELLEKYDRTMRDMINGIFGSDVCTAAFGSTNVLSDDSAGRPIIISFMKALTPVLANEIKEAQTAKQIRLEDKTDKYIKPVTSLNKPFVPLSEPVKSTAASLSALTQEQKNALIMELLK